MSNQRPPCSSAPSSSPASPYVTAQLARGRSPSAARPRAGAFAGERLQQHAASGCLDHLLCCALLLCRSASGGGARQVSSSACCAQTRMASRGAGCWALSFCCAPRTAWPDGTSLSTVLDVKMVEIDARCVACPPHTPPARPTHRSHKPPSMKLSPRSSLRRRLVGFSVPTRRKVLRGFAPLALFLCRRLLVFGCEAVVTHRHRMRV